MHLLCQINYASAKRSADVRPLSLWPSCATHGGQLDTLITDWASTNAAISSSDTRQTPQ